MGNTQEKRAVNSKRESFVQFPLHWVKSGFDSGDRNMKQVVGRPVALLGFILIYYSH